MQFFVSNQSFDDPKVELTVSIDGTQLVSGLFDVKVNTTGAGSRRRSHLGDTLSRWCRTPGLSCASVSCFPKPAVATP
jgi:hypothetical protein